MLNIDPTVPRPPRIYINLNNQASKGDFKNFATAKAELDRILSDPDHKHSLVELSLC